MPSVSGTVKWFEIITGRAHISVGLWSSVVSKLVAEVTLHPLTGGSDGEVVTVHQLEDT